MRRSPGERETINVFSAPPPTPPSHPENGSVGRVISTLHFVPYILYRSVGRLTLMPKFAAALRAAVGRSLRSDPKFSAALRAAVGASVGRFAPTTNRLNFFLPHLDTKPAPLLEKACHALHAAI